MSSIGIGIGHDDNLVVVDIVKVKISSNSCTDSINHGIDFFVFENVCHFGFLSVEDLTSKGKNGLEFTITTLFS